jgi:hypothetical protein
VRGRNPPPVQNRRLVDSGNPLEGVFMWYVEACVGEGAGS